MKPPSRRTGYAAAPTPGGKAKGGRSSSDPSSFFPLNSENHASDLIHVGNNAVGVDEHNTVFETFDNCFDSINYASGAAPA